MLPTRKTIVKLKVNPGKNILPVIDQLFANTVTPDLVFLVVSSYEYPHRTMELPWELVELSGKNPKVKFIWDGDNPLEGDDRYNVIDVEQDTIPQDFIEKRISYLNHEYLDMTMVSVFYDAGINELRKIATINAAEHWLEQYGSKPR